LAMMQYFLLVAVALISSEAQLSPTPLSCGLLGFSCLSVSDCASFVNCNQTIKKCYCLPSFDGNASPASRCTCPAPKQVYFPSKPLGFGSLVGGLWNPPTWTFDDPICVDVDVLLALQADAARQARHRQSVFTFLNNTIWPTPQEILLTKGIPRLTTLLDPNVRSRISPAGAFNGFEGVVEYFYGFVATPGNFVVNLTINSIGSTNNTVGAKATLFLRNDGFASTGGHPPQFWNLSLFTFFTFGANDLITSIDVSVPNLGILLDVPQAYEPGIINFTCQLLTLPTVFSGMAPQGTCGAKNVYLTPLPIKPGQTGYSTTTYIMNQYLNCVTFMNSIPFGSRNRMNANNVVCRNLHALLTPYGPDLHCPHCSPSGGDSCIEFSYESFFAQPY